MNWGNWDSIFHHPAKARTHAAKRDPLSLGVSFLVNIGWGGAISGLGATLVGSALIGAALLGASLLLGAFNQGPQKPSPSDRQSTIRQSTGPRVRFYGRNKVGGTLAFFESKNGYLYSLITLNEGEISQVREVWLNDQKVTLDEDGYVIEAPYRFTHSVTTGSWPFQSTTTTNYKVARILFRTGTANQTAYSELISAFPGLVTADHRLRGVATCLAIFQEVPGEKIGEVYPQGNPGVRIVGDMSLVKSVRTGARIYSDNPADCIYDYLTGRDGAGFAYGAGLSESQINLASFQSFANLCDEAVPKKGGGAIKRYRLAGAYSLNEEMRSVLGRMCKACDADLYIDGNGKVAIRGGKWTAPTLTLDSDQGHIISADFQRGRAALVAFNELTIKYTDPAQDYMEVEAERWIDGGNVALRGKVLPQSLDLEMVPEHAQARRVAKIHTHKANPAWVGTITTNYYGMNAIGEETVTIKFGPMGIDTTFNIDSLRILDDLTGVQLQVSSLTDAAYLWDAELEEGTPPGIPPNTSTPISLDPPEDIVAASEQIIIEGSTVGVRIVVGWTMPDRAALRQHAQYRVSPSGAWQDMQTAEGGGFAVSGPVDDGGTYDYRVRTLSPGGTPGGWSSVGTITVTSDPTPTGVVTGVSASGGAGEITFNWTAPNSPNYAAARLYWNTTDDFDTATLAATEYGAPNSADSRTVTGISAGTRYGWVVATNGSGIAASPVATGAVTVT